MKKLLIISNSTSGLVGFRKEIIRECAEKYEVVILTLGEGGEELTALGCDVRKMDFDRRGTNPLAELKLIRYFEKQIREIAPDLVLTYTIKPNIYAGMVCARRKIPYLTTITGLGTSIENGGLSAFLSLTLYKLGLRGAACVFFQNSANRELFERKKLFRSPAVLIPGSGVNLDDHCPEPYPGEEDGIRFLFVGRVMKNKGIDELVTAIRAVHEKHPEVSLDIVGGFDEDYSEVFDRLTAEGFVRYHGEQPVMHPFYANTHCTVLPSYHEGMANVMLESAATTRPVITTRVPGCRETFDEDVTGLGCDARDADSLTDAMLRFLALSHEEKREMGLAGRKKVEREFDRKLVTGAYVTEIARILGE